MRKDRSFGIFRLVDRLLFRRHRSSLQRCSRIHVQDECANNGQTESIVWSREGEHVPSDPSTGVHEMTSQFINEIDGTARPLHGVAPSDLMNTHVTFSGIPATFSEGGGNGYGDADSKAVLHFSYGKGVRKSRSLSHEACTDTRGCGIVQHLAATGHWTRCSSRCARCWTS